MADITDPQVIAFCNEYVRPVAEPVRAAKLRLQNMDFKNSNDIAPLIAGNADADPIQDGRDAEGISRLTAKDVKDFTYAMALIKGQIEAVAQATIEKPCVRPVQIANIAEQ